VTTVCRASVGCHDRVGVVGFVHSDPLLAVSRLIVDLRVEAGRLRLRGVVDLSWVLSIGNGWR
jgi:hypothetical protein